MPQSDSDNYTYSLARPFTDEQEARAVAEVLASGRLIQGPQVAALERDICRITGANHAIAVSSSTAALHVAFSAAGVQPDDALFIPSFAWPSAANVARVMGAVPVLVDVLPDTYNIDPDHLRERVAACRRVGWGAPKLVVPIHQFGLPCDMEGVRRVAEDEWLEVIEDAACALGARVDDRSVGTLGRLGIFSFHPRKSVTTGEGGVVVTNDDELAHQCRALRNHGQQGPFDFAEPGLNYRMSELHAAVGVVQLSKLETVLKVRRELVAAYRQVLASADTIELPAFPDNHTWQTFLVCVPEKLRSRIIEKLASDHGVEVGIGSVDAHRLSIHQGGPEWVELPVVSRLCDQGLALPLHAGMTPADARVCAEALLSVLTELV